MTKKQLKNLKPGDTVIDELSYTEQKILEVTNIGFSTDLVVTYWSNGIKKRGSGVSHSGDSIKRFKIKEGG